MADSVTCDQCGKVAAKSTTGSWHHVNQRRDQEAVQINPSRYGRLVGDYCTIDCLIKAAKAQRRSDREWRAPQPSLIASDLHRFTVSNVTA